MKASETKLQQILEGTKQYVVPLFQRSYSWDKKEWQVLLDDLLELNEQENPRTHFVGSIVTMPTTSVPEGVAKYLLIDGQQRLTTLFIILTLIRDLAKQNDQEELADEINQTLLVNPFKKELDYFKLLPTQSDRKSFQELIKPQPEQPTPSTSDNQQISINQIQNAYTFFEKKLRGNTIDGQALKKVITSNLSVVSIVLDLDDDPYLVFESLNAKGRPLTQADLIRNYFFMKIHVNQQDSTYTQYWKPLQEGLGNNLTEFIRHYLSKDGAIIKQNEVYFSLKDLVSKGDAAYYLKELARFGRYYHQLLSPQLETNKAISERLLRLNRIEVTTAYPFLLNCYEEFHQKNLTSQEFAEILFVLENFLIRRFVCNIPTMGLNKIFPPLYSQVMNSEAGSFVDRLKKVLQTKGYPKDFEFRHWLKDARLYGAGDRARRTKLILESLEESFGHKEQTIFQNLTIEHVLPQTPTLTWQAHLGGEWILTHELLLHTIGNLTLTGYNPDMSNSDFEVKKKWFNESHLELNKYFGGQTSWKKEDIEKRSEHLADIAVSIWPYFGEETNTGKGPTTVTGTTPTALWLLGQHFKVKSWRDVYEQTLETIADLEPEKFEQIVQQFPHLIGPDKEKFREVRKLKKGLYIEVNLAAQYVQRICFQILQMVELTTEDWKVEAA